MNTTTPKSISDSVMRLCHKIDPTQAPVYVSVKKTNGSQINECFENVRLRVAQEGGSLVYGWIIWEAPNWLIEGVFHAVWKTNVGELIDITPKEDCEQKILFLPDSKREYKNAPVDNIRLPLSNDPFLTELIRTAEGFHGLKSKLNQDGHPVIPGSEMQEFLGEFEPGCDSTPKTRIGRNDRCPCGSGKKFKKCCLGK